MPLPTLLDVLWALDEETRLRIAALLQHGELTVSDLTDILGMSQPRVSRHLNLLAEAGVVDKHREGTWAFFDLVTAGPIGRLVSDVLALIDASDTVRGRRSRPPVDRPQPAHGRRAGVLRRDRASDGTRNVHCMLRTRSSRRRSSR